MNNDNQNEFLQKLEYACTLCLCLRLKDYKLLETNNEIKGIQKQVEYKANKICKFVIVAILIIVLAIFIFNNKYELLNFIKQSYFPIKYNLVSSFKKIGLILILVGKIILVIILLVAGIIILRHIVPFISDVISRLILFIFKHANSNKKNNINMLYENISKIENEINLLKTLLDDSILANYYKEHISDIKIENGSINLVTFAKVTKIYEIDTLLFAFNKSKNDKINWDFSFNK